MASMLNEAEVLGSSDRAEQATPSEGVRLARVCVLDEVPGLVFGLVTIGYLVQSLAGLVR